MCALRRLRQRGPRGEHTFSDTLPGTALFGGIVLEFCGKFYSRYAAFIVYWKKRNRNRKEKPTCSKSRSSFSI